MIPRTPREKKCRCGCGEKFVPTRPMQPTRDNFDCKVRFAERHAAKARERREKGERKITRAKLEAMKPRKVLFAEAQAAFNAFIRFRDLTAGYGCIDCGKPFEPQKFGGAVDAGHYRSVGAAKHLRFDERNCHAQRKNCNRPGGTTHAQFRAGMIARIGLEAVEALEADNSTRHWSADDLRRIRDEYRAKLKALKAGKSSTG